MSSRRVRTELALRGGLTAGGIVATAAGSHSALFGGRSIPPWQTHSPAIESELRFYSAFYAAFGLQLLDAARAPSLDRRRIDLACAALFAAGAARAAAWRDVGAPHPLQRLLLVVELAAPPIVSAWSRLAAKG